MSQIVAATYELMEKIGSGGGGVVYLGQHLRLDKWVVLKADKRTLAAKPEVLRREVDALKNLNHTYIPQVYDFIAEGNTVYTVMDYIEGESLDKPLKRGEHFSQPQVIEWACQLLEALRYLHSRPPHGILHSDIKPANIMLTPQNDIRLIDFNIALALGEEGAVRVGFSQGYASPEHYGTVFPATVSSSRFTKTKKLRAETEKLRPETEPLRTETEKLRTETEPLRAETEKLRTETEPLRTETEQLHSETELPGSETELPDSVSFSNFTDTDETRSETASELLAYDRTEMQGRQFSQWADSGSDSLPEEQPNPPAGGDTASMPGGLIIPSAGSGPAGLPGGQPRPPAGGSSSTSGGNSVLLDVRSDIYSLGATLYHLLTGRRPAKNALEVEPITEVIGISPAVAAIIQKAMNPDPALRYQTAEEMLWDFEHLHEHDQRTKRHKRKVRVVTAALAALFLAGGLCSFTGLRQMQQAAEAAEEVERLAKIAEQEAKDALAAVRGSENAYQIGDTPGAVQYALAGLKTDTVYKNQAQKALTDALGVYDLSDGFKPSGILELPSEPLDMVLSPGGTYLAAVYAYEVAVFDLQSGKALCRLPAEESALADVRFLDENKIVYAAPGAVAAYDISSGTQLWSGEAGTKIACSADGTRVAAIYKDEQEGRVYDARTGELLKTVSFQGRSQRVAANDIYVDPNDSLLALNADGTLMAVSFSDGTLAVFDLVGENDLELLDPSDYIHFEGGFFGKYFAFSAAVSGDSIFAVIDTVELWQPGGFSGESPFLVQADESGIYVATDNVLVGLDIETGEQTEVAYTQADITGFRVFGDYAVVATQDNTYSFFGPDAIQFGTTTVGLNMDYLQLAGGRAALGSWDTPIIRLMRLEEHQDTQVFSYEPGYEHSEARLSADRSTVMLFRHDKFRLYSIQGELLAEVEIPDSGQVFDQQYRRENGDSWLDVIYNDGTVRAYSARDGELLSEQRGEAPDRTLYEEFFTDKYRISSPLHGTPVAYDRESGELVRELEPDTYLTYVTQVGDFVITEFRSSQGERYGLLLDENLETLAKLPNLCDVLDGELVFDYPTGVLRTSRIYSLQELLALAEQ